MALTRPLYRALDESYKVTISLRSGAANVLAVWPFSASSRIVLEGQISGSAVPQTKHNYLMQLARVAVRTDLQLYTSRGVANIRVYRITKNFCDKNFRETSRSSISRKKVSRKGDRAKWGVAWVSTHARMVKAWLREAMREMPTDTSVSLHSRESKMASMKIAGLTRVRQHCL